MASSVGTGGSVRTGGSIRPAAPDVLRDAGPHTADLFGHHALAAVDAADR
ncbi:hypothetical protein ACIP4Q_06675 [Streptomyces massasporeus]